MEHIFKETIHTKIGKRTREILQHHSAISATKQYNMGPKTVQLVP